MIILKKLKLKNFLSHQETEIQFKNNQKLLISGDSGAGKSSLIDGFVWCLYGKSRADARFLVRHHTKKAEVSVLLKDEEKKIFYKIIRSITNTNKHSLDVQISNDNKKFKPVETVGLRLLQEYIERKILKASYFLFINSIVCLQGNENTFVKESASRKKDILLEIINLNDYDSYLKKAKNIFTERRLELESLTTLKTEKENQIEQNKTKIIDIEYYQKEIDKNNRLLNEVNAAIALLTRKQKDIIKKISFIEGKETILNDIINKIKNNEIKKERIKQEIQEKENVDIKNLKNKVARLQSLKIELDKLDKERENLIIWKEKYQKIEAELKPLKKDYDIDIKNINQDIIKIMQEKIPVCHVCGTPYIEFEKNKQARIKELEIKLKILEDRKKEYEQSIINYQKAINDIGKSPIVDLSKRKKIINEIYVLKGSEEKLLELANNEKIIENLKQNLKTINIEQEEYKQKKATLEIEIKNKASLKLELQKIEENIHRNNDSKIFFEEKKRRNNNSLLLCQEALKNIEKNKKDLIEIKQKIILIKEDIEALKLIKEAFGVNGIKSMVIDYMLPELEDRINNILGKLSDFTISINTQKSGASKDTILEGLFITITNEIGEEMDFDLFSGGEKMKISYAINEALASLSKCNFRFLDETFFALDEENLINFVKIVELLQQKVKNVILITHIQQIKDLFKDKITIIKKNGISKKIN